MAVRIGPVIGIEGEAEYRASLRRIVQESETLSAQMDLMTASFKNNESTLSKNKQTVDSLTQQIRKQGEVVEETSKMVERSKEAEQDAIRARDKQIGKINESISASHKEQAALDELKIKIGEGSEARSKQQTVVDNLQKEYDKEAKILETVTKNVGENNYVTAEHKEKLKQIGDELEKEKGVLKKWDDELEKQEKAVKDTNSELEKNKKNLESHEAGIERAKERTSKWEEETAKAERKLAELNKQLKETPNSLQTIGSAIENVGGKISSFGDSLTQYITTPIIAASTAAVKFAADFQDGMAKVYTIADESEVPMEEMANGLKALSDESGFGLDDLAEASYQAVSASVKTGDALEFVTDSAKLARAGFTDVTTAVDILSTIQNSYGKGVYSTAEAMDILLKTQNDGKTVVGQLASRMGIIIPMAKNYGVSLEEIAAGYATMTKQGVKTEQATTYFRAMFTELEKEGSKVNEMLVDMTGKTFADLEHSGYNLSEILKMLWNSVDGDAEAFQRLFGNVRSTQAIAALSANDFRTLDEELVNMSHASGLVDEALEKLQTPGLQARKTLNRLKNITEEFGEDLIESFLPVFEKVVDVVEKVAKAYREADKPTRDLVRNIVLAAAAIGPVVKVIGMLITGVGSIVSSFGAWGALLSTGVIPGITTLGGAVAMLTPAITTLAAAGLGLWFYNDWANKQFDQYIENTYGLTEAERGLIDTVNGHTEAMRQSREARAESVNGINEEFAGIESLVEKYNSLIDENGNVIEGEEGLADVLLTQVAEALGLTKDQVKELTDENGKLTGSIDEIIEAKKRDAIMSAYEADYQEAIKNRKQILEDIRNAQDGLNESKDKGTELEHELAELERQNLKVIQATGEGMDGYIEKHEELEAAIAQNKENTAEFEQALKDANAELSNSDNMITNYERAMEAITSGSENAGFAIEQLTSEVKNAGDSTGEELEKQYQDYVKFYEDLQQAVEEGRDGVTQADVDKMKEWVDWSKGEWEKFKEQSGEAASDASQAEATNINRYQTEGQKRAAQQKQMQLDGYKDTDDTAGRYSRNMSSSYANSADDYAGTAHDNAEFLKNSALNGLAGGADEAYTRGEAFSKGYASGLLSASAVSALTAGANSIVSIVNGAVSSAQRDGSPSKLAAERGEMFGRGYAMGIDSTAGLVSSSATNLVRAAMVDSMMMSNYSPNGNTWATTRNVNAPITVSVNVNGNVDNVEDLANVIADRINEQVLAKQGAF